MHRILVMRLVAPAMLAAMAVLGSGCGGASAGNSLSSRLLSASNLPAGWKAAPASSKDVQLASSPCFSALPKKPKGWTYRTASFVDGTSIPNLGEVLAQGPQAQQTWQRMESALAACRTATLLLAGTKVRAAVQPLAFPQVGQRSSAYAWTFTYSGIAIGSDLVMFQDGTYDGYISYSDLEKPPVAAVTAFARAAVSKAETGSTVSVPDNLSITSVPVQTVRTTMGRVAYRSIGTGPPLVMITGYGGTMQGWDRRFVDALARRYRVVIFDNAGVGRTQSLRAPLTIDAMANQTSAFIQALGLDQPDILGWSMGSMIAQALAVLHPAQVHRLILCASYPGTGAAVPPSRATLNAFESGNPQQVMAALFPADQTAAQNGYLAAISSYPSAPPAPKATVNAQGRAVDEWWAGQDAAGTRATDIAVPTLVADGTADRLDPVANSRLLANLIPGAKLQLYPDAGHAFLFQDQTDFVPLIQSFLG